MCIHGELLGDLNSGTSFMTHYVLAKEAKMDWLRIMPSIGINDPFFDFLLQKKCCEILEKDGPVGGDMLLQFYLNKEVDKKNLQDIFQRSFVTSELQDICDKEKYKDFCTESFFFSHFKGDPDEYYQFNNFSLDLFGIELCQLRTRLQDLTPEDASYENLSALLIDAQYVYYHLGPQMGSADSSEILGKYLCENLESNDSNSESSIVQEDSKNPERLFDRFINIIKYNKDVPDGYFSNTVKLLESFFFGMEFSDILAGFFTKTDESYENNYLVGLILSYQAYLISEKLGNFSSWLKVKKIYSITQYNKPVRRNGISFIGYYIFLTKLGKKMIDDEDSWKYHYWVSRLRLPLAAGETINFSYFHPLNVEEKNLEWLDVVTEQIIEEFSGGDCKKKRFKERIDRVKKFLRYRRNYIQKILLGNVFLGNCVVRYCCLFAFY